MTDIPPTFDEAYATYRRRIFSLCLRMVKNPDDAEDLVQEVFMQLHRKMSLFRGDSSFSTWLHRIAVNTVLMKLRGNKAKWQRGLQSIEQMAEDDLESGGNKSLDRALLIQDLELNTVVERVAIDTAIENMPHGYRLVFDLVEVQGFTHEETARVLGCSVGNSKSQLHKAHLWLAEELGVEYREPDQVDDLLENFDQWLEDAE